MQCPYLGEVTDFAEQKVENIQIARCHDIGNIGQVPNSIFKNGT